jgi:hypothetical protein
MFRRRDAGSMLRPDDIGAGDGEPGLVTAKGFSVIAAADDALLPGALLNDPVGRINGLAHQFDFLMDLRFAQIPPQLDQRVALQTKGFGERVALQ